MTRDDSSGGWLAQDGCLSRVGVCRLLPTEFLGRNTFLIHGERLKDRQVGAGAAGAEAEPKVWIGLDSGPAGCCGAIVDVVVAT